MKALTFEKHISSTQSVLLRKQCIHILSIGVLYRAIRRLPSTSKVFLWMGTGSDSHWRHSSCNYIDGKSEAPYSSHLILLRKSYSVRLDINDHNGTRGSAFHGSELLSLRIAAMVCSLARAI